MAAALQQLRGRAFGIFGCPGLQVRKPKPGILISLAAGSATEGQRLSQLQDPEFQLARAATNMMVVRAAVVDSRDRNPMKSRRKYAQ